MSRFFKTKVETIDHEITTLQKYKGKVILIVNTASLCDQAKQMRGLQKLYDELDRDKLEIIAFPCNQFANQEPGTDEEIKKIYQEEYGVTFPIMAKIEVNGRNAHPLYKQLVKARAGLNGARIEWNFVKFIIDASGKILVRYFPNKTPVELEQVLVPLMEDVDVTKIGLDED